MKTKVCKSCGYVGTPIRQCYGSFIIDVFAWMVAFSIAGMTGLLPVLLFPLAWTIYHVAKFNTTKCPKCEQLDMVSISRRKAKELHNH